MLANESERLVAAVESFPAVGDQFGDFRIIELIGEGKYSRVYLAQQGELADRHVVLKVSPELWAESEMLARLQHTNIVPVYSIHQSGHLQAICMPYLGRLTLVDVLRKTEPGNNGKPKTIGFHGGSRFDERSCCQFMAKIAQGLEHAHRRGIVHRDLKPANVLVSTDDEPLILDFNLSEDIVVGGPASLMVGGTLPYMSPEHLRASLTGDRVDHRCDIYSLGIVLYQAATGQLPFPKREGSFVQSVSLMAQDRQTRHDWKAKIANVASPDFVSIVAKCLASDPDSRYESAEQLSTDLLNHATDRPLAHAPNRSLKQRSQKWLRRNRHLASLSSIVSIASVAIILLAIGLGVQSQRTAKLDARQRFRAFEDAFASTRDELSVPLTGTEFVAESVAQGEQLLSQYVTDAAWQSAPKFRLLPRQEQQYLKQNLGELAYLLALSAEADDDGDPTGDADDDNPAAQQRLHELAVACFSPAVPVAVSHVAVTSESEVPPSLKLSSDAPPLDRRLYAVLKMRDGDYGQAQPILTELVRKEPTNAALWLMLGNCAQAEGDSSLAELHYTRYLGLNPDSVRVLFYRGQTRMSDDRWSLALEDFDEVLRRRPNLAGGLLARSIVHKHLGNLPAALDDLNTLIAMGQRTSHALLLRSDVNRELGNESQADEDLRMALRTQPTTAEGWIARGTAQVSSEPIAALADFETALVWQPSSFVALQNIAHIYAEKLNQPETALKTVDEILAIRPEYAVARVGRGVLLARLKNQDEAIQDLEAGLQLSRSAEVCYLAASGYALLSESKPELAAVSVELARECLRQDATRLDRLVHDPDFKALHDNSELKKILASVQLIHRPHKSP